MSVVVSEKNRSIVFVYLGLFRGVRKRLTYRLFNKIKAPNHCLLHSVGLSPVPVAVDYRMTFSKTEAINLNYLTVLMNVISNPMLFTVFDDSTMIICCIIVLFHCVQSILVRYCTVIINAVKL